MDDKRLINLYLKGYTYKDIAAVWGTSAFSVGNRLTALRKAGVELPKPNKRRNQINVKALNNYIRRLAHD